MDTAPQEDRAVGIGIFVRSQGRSEQDALAWMRAEGIDAAVAAAAWSQSEDRYRRLLRRLARTDMMIGGSLFALGMVLGVVTWQRAWDLPGYVFAVFFAALGLYACRSVPARLQGRPGRADLEQRAWMLERYPNLPGGPSGRAV